jgi:hypothetical protein
VPPLLTQDEIAIKNTPKIEENSINFKKLLS